MAHGDILGGNWQDDPDGVITTIQGKVTYYDMRIHFPKQPFSH